MHANVNTLLSHLSSGWPVPCADDPFILLSLHIHLRPVKTGPFQVSLLDCGSLVILLLLVHIRQLECQKDYFQWKNLRKPLKPSFVTLRASKG